MMDREQYMREIRKNKAKLVKRAEKRERIGEVLVKGALGLAGVGVFFLFFGTIGLSIIGASTMVRSFIRVAGKIEE